MGDKFIFPPAAKLNEIYQEIENKPSIPFIFVLSPGADPISELIKLAEGKGFK